MNWIAWVIRHPGKADEFLILSDGGCQEYSDWIWPPLISSDSYEVSGSLLFDDVRANQLLRELDQIRLGGWNLTPEGYWATIIPRARIGRGGGGNKPGIPPCEYCGAYGGGGHGGFCPNQRGGNARS